MAYLAKAKKIDLCDLAEEMGIEVDPQMKVIEIKKLILNHETYEEAEIKIALERIIEERKELQEMEERKELREIEERKALREREDRERESQRAFELERLRLESSSVRVVREDERPGASEPKVPAPDLRKMMHKFDPNETDISLYLTIFERQANQLKVGKNTWVSQLIALLPIDIVQMIMREPEESTTDYDFVKKLLLQRFKLSPEAFRNKFSRHQRKTNGTWRDYVFELQSYFNGWLEGLEVTTFEKLKELVVTDQVKRHVPSDVRDHFLDDWGEIISPLDFADRLDRYEILRRPSKKIQNFSKDRFFEKTQEYGKVPKKYENPVENPKTESPKKPRSPVKENKDRFQNFDRRKSFRCYECNSPDHLRPQCPFKEKRETERLNHIEAKNLADKYLTPYMLQGRVNGREIDILRDTGSTIDIICSNLVCPKDYTGENIWLKQPLDKYHVRLPLANTIIEGDFGRVLTKAAVVDKALDTGRYLLGNRSAELILNSKNGEKLPICELNATGTRTIKECQEGVEAVAKEIPPENAPESIVTSGESTDETENLVLKEKEDVLVGNVSQNASRRDLIEHADGGHEIDKEINFPILESSPNIFDFKEIIRESELESGLDPLQLEQLQKVLSQHSKSFSNSPGKTDLVEYDIDLISAKSIRSRPYKSSHRQNEILKIEIEKMLNMGIIEEGESDFTSPIMLVDIPNEDPVPCVDYRGLNEIIKTKIYPLPNVEECIEKVASAKFITILNLEKCYMQIPLSAKAQRIASFVTSFGTYRPLRMLFGLKNASYYFNKLMAEILKGCEDFAVPYLDDIAIFTDTWEDHLKGIREILKRISDAHLTIKPSKCRFAQCQVKYLGHIVGGGHRTPASAKVMAIENFPQPVSKAQVKALLELAKYYAPYIKDYSKIVAPLMKIMKERLGKEKIVWDNACSEAFKILKERLVNKPVLFAPDFSKPFILQTDASEIGLGAVLTQVTDGEEHPVLYLRKRFTVAERSYCTTEKECASIIYAVKKLHYYLDGQPFTIVTDHNPLVWLKTNASSNSRLTRWSLALQPYNFEIKHRPGRENQNADSLSRAEVD